jgi:hypothetical protein
VLLQEYLGITGNPEFNELSAKLAFGENSTVIREGRNSTVQCLSGTGSLRVRQGLNFSYIEFHPFPHQYLHCTQHYNKGQRPLAVASLCS